MLKYKEGIESIYCKNSGVEKNRNKLLEDALRMLGNFDDNQPIEINKCKFASKGLDIVYEVVDKEGNIFSFKNFDVGKELIGDKRFRENYYLYVKKPNNKTTYKYDFVDREYNSEHDTEKVRLIEVSYSLSEDKTVKLERKPFLPVKIIVKLEDKDYIIGYEDTEYDLELLGSFGDIIDKIMNAEIINLDSIMHIVSEPNKVDFCQIKKNNELIASANLIRKNVISYILIDKYREIKANISSETTTRKVEAKGQEICRETLNNDNGVLQMEINRLMKTL